LVDLCNAIHDAIDMHFIYRVAQKVSRYQMIQKSYEIALKPVNKIIFIRQIKVSIKHYNIIPWY